MAKTKTSKSISSESTNKIPTSRGQGGETHQTSIDSNNRLTTNQGVALSDNQNSLKAGVRGPTLLEDFILREKITHFDHERIPERIVHARGSAAHGYFQPYKSLKKFTKAQFLQDPNEKTKVFVRFSTVAGGAGSNDTVRDVRGFSVKFYTQEGNYDLVGNNIPVFFIQDAMKFPDLIHSVKMEPDRGYPQAGSAHSTFWDFASLMPESMHMLMWAMSDRAIPRSYRTMDGFGVHTFKLINEKGEATFVKFHWRSKQGCSSLVWDEAVKLQGADSDFHRRDLFEAIESGHFPEYELCIQAFDEAFVENFAKTYGADVLDSTKLIPEELIPLQAIGKMVLDRNVDNLFAETEQVAFHPGHVVPGIDFSDDPLLQGRIFSYLDTQLSRLGGPNFHEIPVNRPVCPMRNFQRDGISRQQVPTGRVAYEPNSLDPQGPRESPKQGFVSHAQSFAQNTDRTRERSESFSDHYSQARMFYKSMSKPEQEHIQSAFAFELGKVDVPAVRLRMLGHLKVIEGSLHQAVSDLLGLPGQGDAITPAKNPLDLKPSKALSLTTRKATSPAGKVVGLLVGDGANALSVREIIKSLTSEGVRPIVVAPKIGGAKLDDGSVLPGDQALAAAPSVLFDAVCVAVPASNKTNKSFWMNAEDFVKDAYRHGKILGLVKGSEALAQSAYGGATDEGVLAIENSKSAKAYVAALPIDRIWSR